MLFKTVFRAATTVAPVCAIFLLTLTSESLAQTPLNVGSASGWGIGAMTEARFGESVLWNPALVALPDVASSSFGLLQFDGVAELTRDTPAGFIGPGWGMLRQKKSDEGFADEWLFDDRAYSMFGGRARGSVVWLSGHLEEFGFSATSTFYGDFALPVRALHILNGSIAGSATPSDLSVAESFPSDYGAYTTLALARSEYLGRFGPLGHTWVGASIKYTFIHRTARGRVRYGDADEIAQSLPFDFAGAELSAPQAHAFVYDIWEVRDGRAVGADVGLVSNPFGQLLVSAALSNVYQSTSFEPNRIALNQFWSLGRENGYEGMRGEGREQDIVLPEGVDDYLPELVKDMHFPRVARIGAALDVRKVRLAAGFAVPIEDGDAIGRDDMSELGGSIAYMGKFSPRASYERRMDGASVYSVGAQLGTCGKILRAGLSFIDGTSRGLGLSLGVTLGAPPCGWGE